MNLYKILASALCLLLLSSCGQEGDNALEGNLNLGNNDETIVSSPDSVVASYQIEHSNVDSTELSSLELPYDESLFPAISANDSIWHDKCHSSYSSKCVVNKQVVFKFDLTQFKKNYPSTAWTIQEISLKTTLASPYDANPREEICLLNFKRCNGSVILPVADDLDDVLFQYIANEDFWTQSISSIIPKNTIMNYLAAILDQSANTWYVEDVSLPISQMLVLNEENHKAIYQNDSLYFLVTDDVYVENPALEIVVKEL